MCFDRGGRGGGGDPRAKLKFSQKINFLSKNENRDKGNRLNDKNNYGIIIYRVN